MSRCPESVSQPPPQEASGTLAKMLHFSELSKWVTRVPALLEIRKHLDLGLCKSEVFLLPSCSGGLSRGFSVSKWLESSAYCGMTGDGHCWSPNCMCPSPWLCLKEPSLFFHIVKHFMIYSAHSHPLLYLLVPHC